MKISIITVCYNASHVIEKCIKSVADQDYQNLEYLIIDGGSTDGTLEIINNFSESIDLIVSERDHGIYDAMNKGLVRASGDWFLFLNSDDTLASSDCISSATKYLLDNSKNYYGIANIQFDSRTLRNKPKAGKPIDFEKELPIHQTVFVSSKYKHLNFDSSYKICADSVYLYRLSKITTFDFIPVTIANFSLGGASSWYNNSSEFLNHLRESIRFKTSHKFGAVSILYTLVAYSIKFLMSKFLSKTSYFNLVSHVAQLKEGL